MVNTWPRITRRRDLLKWRILGSRVYAFPLDINKSDLSRMPETLIARGNTPGITAECIEGRNERGRGRVFPLIGFLAAREFAIGNREELTLFSLLFLRVTN